MKFATKHTIDLGAAQSHFRLGSEFFRLAQPARAENYGSTAIMHPKLMHAPTGPITGRSCRCMSSQHAGVYLLANLAIENAVTSLHLIY